jgi:hypothetical protein
MKRVESSTITRVMAGCLLLTLCASAQSSNNSADGAKLVALERMWNQAQLVRDSAAVAGMIGDKFVNTEYDGEVSDRGKFLADFADPKFQPSLMSIDDVKVEMYSNTAIVTGTYHTKGTYGSKPYEHIGRFTDTWLFQDGRWLCVASHTSLLKK